MNEQGTHNQAIEGTHPSSGLSLAAFRAEVGSCTNSDPGPDPTYDEDPIPDDESWS